MRFSQRAFLLFLPFIFYACAEDGSTGPTGSGVIWGYVDLYNVDGAALKKADGIKVQFEGTDYSAVTVDDGKWKIEDVPAGTYFISYTKEGFGFVKSIGTQFVGKGEYYVGRPRLLQIPTFSITSFSAAWDPDKGAIDIAGTVSEKDASYYSRSILLLYSTNPNKQFELSTNWSLRTISVYPDSSTFTSFVPPEILASHGIMSGSTIHLKAYSYNNNASSGQYFDPYLQKSFYTAVPEQGSDVVTIVIP